MPVSLPPIPNAPIAGTDGWPTRPMLAWMNGVQSVAAPITSLVYNVVDYGAFVDGTADDSAAVVATCAAAAAGGGLVYFPPGVCLTSPFAVPSGCAGLLGAGRGVSTIKIVRAAYAAAQVMIDFAGSTSKPTMTGLAVDVNDAQFEPTWTIRLDCDDPRVSNVRIFGGAAGGIVSRSGSRGLVDNCFLNGLTTNGISVGVYTDTTSTRFTVRDVHHDGPNTYSVNISSGVGNLIDGCTVKDGVTVAGGFGYTLSLCTTSTITNCYALDTYAEAFAIFDASYCSVVNNRAEWNVGKGTDFGVSVAGNAGLGAKHNIISNNTFINSYKTGLAVAAEAQYNIFENNQTINCGTRLKAAGGIDVSAILAYTDGTGGACYGNTFRNNKVTITAGSIDYGCLEVLGLGSVNKTLFESNEFAGTITTRYGVLVGALSSVIEPEWQDFTSVVTNTGGGGFVATLDKFNYQLNGKQCSINFAVTVTNAGAGGFVNLTMPFTGSSRAGVVQGRETAVTGFNINGIVNGVNLQLQTYNNAATAVLNYVLRGTGTYQIA